MEFFLFFINNLFKQKKFTRDNVNKIKIKIKKELQLINTSLFIMYEHEIQVWIIANLNSIS